MAKTQKGAYTNMEDEDMVRYNDAMDNWSEIHWTKSDWADWYGVDEEDLEDAMDSDGSLYD